MKINFLVNTVFDGWSPHDTRLGGTEGAVVEWAEELVKRGHKVYIYLNRSKEFADQQASVPAFCCKNGVYYTERNRYGQANSYGLGDVCINIKSPEVAPKEPTIFYTNDVDADKQDLSAYDAVIHISKWAKHNIPVNNDNVFVVPHGYDDTQIYPEQKIPKQCFYASSPDRGLDTLLEAWPSVVAAHPDAMLLVTYGAPARLGDLKNVMFLGEVDEDTMNEIYRTSDIWTHPCNGGELYCITGIKAQAAGCVPVIIPTMALSETVRTGYFTDKEHYAELLIEAMQPDSDAQDIRNMLSEIHYPTIKDSTDELLKVINFVV